MTAETEGQFASAFAIAKKALTYIGTFKTPPTPEVFELWYRFVEGSNDELTDELSQAMEGSETVSSSFMQQLHERFFPSNDAEFAEKAAHVLNTELGNLQSTIEEQLLAGNNFNSSVSAVGEDLSGDVTAEMMRQCIESVLSSSKSLQRQIEQTDAKLEESQRQITELRRNLQQSQKAMLTDSLTGIGNRRYFDVLLAETLKSHQVQTTDTPLPNRRTALMLIDLDEFKKINDTYGHIAGDEVLRFVANEMQRLSGDASLARIGGDEFAILQRAEDGSAVAELAESIRGFFAEQEFALTRSQTTIGQLTVSIGAAFLRDSDDRKTWFGRADQLLYGAKNSGRNKVMVEPKLGR